MKSKVSLRTAILSAPAVALLFGLLTVPASVATPYFWDIDGATPGAGGPAPNGAWDTTGTSWSTSSTGTVGTAAYTTQATDDLFFSAGTNATGSYAVGLTSTQNASSLAFQEGTATISGAAGLITLGGAGGKITVNNGAAALIGANTDTIVGGAVGLTKMGVGTLTLNGTVANTFTGGVIVNGGTLALNFTNMITPTDLINNSNTLSVGGGHMAITSKGASATTTQTLGNVTVNSGGGSILINPNGGTSTSVTLGTLTTTAGGGSLLLGKASGAGAGTLDITTTSGALTNGIYSGRMVFADGTANTGYDWATTLSSGPVYSISAYGGSTALAASGTDTNNSFITATTSLAGSVTTNSLKFANPASAQTFTIGTGNVLELTSGGLLLTGASVAQGPRIAGGSITAGNGSGSYDLLLHSYNATAQNIVVGVTGANLGLVTTISSNIVNNGANPVTLVKNGPGGVVLTGANTFTGGIVVNGGTLGSNSAGGINNNAFTFNANSTLYTFSTSSTTGQFTLNNNSLVTILNNNSSFTITGKVTGTGGINVAQGGQGSITVNLNSTDNDFTGPIRYSHSQFNQSAHITVASLVDTTSLGEGNITLGLGVGAGTNSHNFNYGAAAIVPLTLNNRRFELATTQIQQSINNNSSQAFTINTDLLSSGSGYKTLTLGGTGSGISTFAGIISQGSSTLHISKGGTGIWVLPGANTYTGATRTSPGTLIVNSIANGGSPSSIGQSSNLAANLVLSGGTLLYAPIETVGGGAATTDRLFTITASSSIDSSGTGPLVFDNAEIISPDVSGLTGTWAAANTNLINGLSSTANLAVGMRVVGAGLPATATIATINGPNQVRLSAQPTTAATVATAVTFGTPTARTLTLTGTNTDANTIAGSLQDSSATGAGVLSLTKAGLGTWVLTGFNNYTGPTTVSAGTLALVGGSLKSPVTVSDGASLGFTLGSPTTSSSTFNMTDGTIKISGTPTAASYTLITNSAGIIGTPLLYAPIPGYELQVDGNTLKLVGTSSNTYATWIAGFPVGALTSFTDDADGDGIKNGVENFLGTNPSTSSGGLVASTLTGGTFTFTHPQNATPASDVTAAYLGSKDLAGFNASGATDGAGTTVIFTTQLNTPAPGTTTVTATVTGTATTRLFVELKATQN